MMTAAEILSQLDKCASDFSFPVLDNGYVYPADVRLSVYRDHKDWLMIIEVLGANNGRLSAFDTFTNCLHLFGSRLHREPGMANEDFLYPIDPDPDHPLFDTEWDWFAREDAQSVFIRQRRVSLNLSEEQLAAKGIKLIEPPGKDPPAILRSLLPEHRLDLLATDDELAQRNPHSLPLWLRLDEWNHPDLTNEETPGNSETFRMLAEAIAHGDASHYRPTVKPNTHWRNWPEGGTL